MDQYHGLSVGLSRIMVLVECILVLGLGMAEEGGRDAIFAPIFHYAQHRQNLYLSTVGVFISFLFFFGGYRWVMEFCLMLLLKTLC